MIAATHIDEIYAGCRTDEEFESARRRINLWLLCDIDPETASMWLEKQMEETHGRAQ